MTAPPAAQAQVKKQIVYVPCSSVALANAIGVANGIPATLRLSAHCTYNFTTALPVIVRDHDAAGRAVHDDQA